MVAKFALFLQTLQPEFPSLKHPCSPFVRCFTDAINPPTSRFEHHDQTSNKDTA